jgi:hypothetical protein
VLALEPLRGLRVIASPEALDGARWSGRVTLLRIAPDEVLAIDAITVDVDDPEAIVERETGFVGARLTPEDVEHVTAHMDWPLPTETGVLAQGKIAGVPAKILISESLLLVTNAAYVDELLARLR